MNTFPLYLVALAASLSACAQSGTRIEPILDGPANAHYSADLQACRALARNQKQIKKATLGQVAVGAGLGAALGAADTDGSAVDGAVAGIIGGGLAGVQNASEHRSAIIIECLRGRGHNVVG